MIDPLPDQGSGPVQVHGPGVGKPLEFHALVHGRDQGGQGIQIRPGAALKGRQRCQLPGNGPPKALKEPGQALPHRRTGPCLGAAFHEKAIGPGIDHGRGKNEFNALDEAGPGIALGLGKLLEILKQILGVGPNQLLDHFFPAGKIMVEDRGLDPGPGRHLPQGGPAEALVFHAVKKGGEDFGPALICQTFSAHAPPDT